MARLLLNPYRGRPFLLYGVWLLPFFLTACAVAPYSDNLIKQLENRIAQTDKEIAILQQSIKDSLALIEIQEKKIRAYESILGAMTMVSGNYRSAGQSEPIEAPPAIEPELNEPQLNSSPGKEYQKALNSFYDRRYQTSREQFAAFLTRHPDHPLSDNALYWTGECWYSEKHYAKAVSVFKTLVDRYPNRNKAPDAFLKIGYAFFSLKDYPAAETYLKRAASFGGETKKKAGRLMRRIQDETQQPVIGLIVFH